jgi:DNA-directed RNA polymerase specialized sigma24 family protein
MRHGDDGTRNRIAALQGGDARAIARFLEEIAPPVWTACSLLTLTEDEARGAFLETIAKLHAGDFALLACYAGRGTLEAGAALATRDLLAARVQRLLRDAPEKGWRAFEAFFETDLRRLIRRRIPDGARGDLQKDAYQSICLALIEKDYRRLKAYAGSGSFAGFVLRTADRLLIDFLRGTKVHPGAHHTSAGTGELRDVPDAAETLPDMLLVRAEDDRRLAAALDVLTRAAKTLSESEQLYLTIALAGPRMPPAREIARAMQRPVEDVYKLRQLVLTRLRDLIAEDSAVKSWRASV